MKEKIVLTGGGGLAGILIELIKNFTEYEIVGILDSQLKVGQIIQGVSVLGNDDLLSKLYADGVKNACISVGSIKADTKRRMQYEKVRRIGFAMPSIVHPQAIISESAEIHQGSQIMAGAIIQTGSSIGENVLIYSGAIVEHDCQVNSNVHICPGVTLSGGCVIGENSYIGAGATVIQGIVIGSDVTVGAGSVVISDVPDGITIKGVPAK
jgi:UDP-perosamine 4-acetyltransferase